MKALLGKQAKRTTEDLDAMIKINKKKPEKKTKKKTSLPHKKKQPVTPFNKNEDLVDTLEIEETKAEVLRSMLNYATKLRNEANKADVRKVPYPKIFVKRQAEEHEEIYNNENGEDVLLEYLSDVDPAFPESNDDEGVIDVDPKPNSFSEDSEDSEVEAEDEEEEEEIFVGDKPVKSVAESFQQLVESSDRFYSLIETGNRTFLQAEDTLEQLAQLSYEENKDPDVKDYIKLNCEEFFLPTAAPSKSEIQEAIKPISIDDITSGSDLDRVDEDDIDQLLDYDNADEDKDVDDVEKDNPEDRELLSDDEGVKPTLLENTIHLKELELEYLESTLRKEEILLAKQNRLLEDDESLTETELAEFERKILDDDLTGFSINMKTQILKTIQAARSGEVELDEKEEEAALLTDEEELAYEEDERVQYESRIKAIEEEPYEEPGGILDYKSDEELNENLDEELDEKLDEESDAKLDEENEEEYDTLMGASEFEDDFVIGDTIERVEGEEQEEALEVNESEGEREASELEEGEEEKEKLEEWEIPASYESDEELVFLNEVGWHIEHPLENTADSGANYYKTYGRLHERCVIIRTCLDEEEDAADYFLDELIPKIEATIPDVKIMSLTVNETTGVHPLYDDEIVMEFTRPEHAQMVVDLFNEDDLSEDEEEENYMCVEMADESFYDVFGILDDEKSDLRKGEDEDGGKAPVDEEGGETESEREIYEIDSTLEYDPDPSSEISEGDEETLKQVRDVLCASEGLGQPAAGYEEATENEDPGPISIPGRADRARKAVELYTRRKAYEEVKQNGNLKNLEKAVEHRSREQAYLSGSDIEYVFEPKKSSRTTRRKNFLDSDSD